MTDSNFTVPKTTLKILTFSGHAYLIAIGRGEIDARTLADMFDQILEKSASVPHCKVLIDLEDVTLRLHADLEIVFNAFCVELEARTSPVAIVCPPQPAVSRRLGCLKKPVGRGVLRLELFNDTKSAVTWLGSLL